MNLNALQTKRFTSPLRTATLVTLQRRQRADTGEPDFAPVRRGAGRVARSETGLGSGRHLDGPVGAEQKPRP